MNRKKGRAEKNSWSQFLFGSISIKPPGFLTALFQAGKSGIKKIQTGIKNYKTAHPNQFLIINIIVPIIIISIIGIKIWQNNQIKPQTISMYTQPPGITPLKENAIPDPLVITFTGSAAKLEDVGKVVTTGLSMAPELSGQWRWGRDDRLIFQPTVDWPADTKFKVVFNKTLFPEHIHLETYETTFKTEPFKLSIVSNRFYIDPRDENIKQVAATVQFTHAVDPLSFEKKIVLKPYNLDKEETAFQKREYKIDITYDEYYGKAYILSEPLPMPEDDVYMELTVKEGVRAASKGNPTKNKDLSRVVIPGITNYIRINSITQDMVRNDEYQLEQVLIIHSKGKANAQDLLQNMEVWILPVDLPSTPGTKKVKNYHWSDPSMIGPEVLKNSTRLTLDPIPAEHDYEEINSFKIEVRPRRYLYIKLKKGMPFYGKYYLPEDYNHILQIKDYPKQLEIMHDGVLLSTTGEKKISILSQGLKGVKFRIGRVLPDQLNHLITQSNGDFTNIQFQNYRFHEDNIVENFYETRSLRQGQPGEPIYTAFNFSNYYQSGIGADKKYGVFFLQVQEWDPQTRRTGRQKDNRLIIISDLGVLLKDGTGSSHDLFIQSITTGLPVSGAKVEVLGKNGLPVLSSLTDPDGHVHLPPLISFSKEKTPVVYVISKGNDLSFMPVNAPGRWLNYSRFDVGGVHGAADPKRLNGYLFSDRGIYRPGDMFHIGMIVKTGDWKYNITGTPLEVAINDARGLEIYKEKFRLSGEGFRELQYTTENTSPTGTYQINLYTLIKNNKQMLQRHRMIGSTSIRIEEFLPDRLIISSTFPDVSGRGWVSPEGLKGKVTLRNLHGTPAAGHRIAAEMTLSPGRLWFRKFRDYHFTDPHKRVKSYTESLEDQITDKQGKALFEFDLERFEAATYSLNFTATGYEKEGGRSVTTSANILLSPLSYLIGTKANSDLSYIHRGSERSVQVIGISPDLKQVSVPQIRFELNEIKHISVLTKKPNGTYAYKSVEKIISVSHEIKTIPAAGLKYALPTDSPGEYELTILNQNGMEFSRTRFSVIGMENLTRSLDKTTELQVKLNKTDYLPGEEIEIYVKAPYTGAGLITIERDKIYAYQWFNSSKTSFIKKIRLPESLEGNGYINVSFVRAADSKEIYMSPLSYGVAPFFVSKGRHLNKITMDIPEQARSGEPFPITYQSEKPGKIVVFAVDEGILQVADYQTPDPLGHFFKKRALEVRTAQILDLILPEFSLLKSFSATGGGYGFEEIAKNLNPFKRKQHKPVVYWSGIQDTDSTPRKLSYTVPDYFNGTLRVMAVAVSQEAIGTFAEKSIVKNPFVISPNAPMFAAPGDSFAVSVTVTNAVDGSGQKTPVNLEISCSRHLAVINSQHSLNIDEDSDTTLTFYVKTNNLPGGATLTFKATGANETTRLNAYLSVRPAIPYQTTVQTGMVKKDKMDVPTRRRMYDQYRVLNASASFLPLGLSKGLKTYLDRFPYGCSEQVVSQAFPYLFLKDIQGFEIDGSNAAAKIRYALKVLQARQNSEGLIGIWAANAYTSDFITVYAVHFITECKEAGYYVSDLLEKKGILALKKIAGKKTDNFNELRTQTYAIYILTRNEIITTKYIASTRKALEKDHGKYWREDIAGGYLAASYRLMEQQSEGLKIIKKAAGSQLKKETPWHFCNRFTQNTQLLYLLAKHFPEQLKVVSPALVSAIASDLQRGWINTIHSAYAIMGFQTYSEAAGTPAEGRVEIHQILKDKQEQLLPLSAGNFPATTFSSQAQKLVIRNKEVHPLYFQVVQAGYETRLPEETVSNGIEVYREFTDKSGKPVQVVSLGQEVHVHLRFRSLSNRSLRNIAVVDLLPAGLEAVPTSVRNNTRGSWRPEYTDIREDRLVIFGTVSSKTDEFVYAVRAINKGRFTVPPMYAESMYDKTIYGITPQKPLVVE